MKTYIFDASVILCYIQEEDQRIVRQIQRLLQDQQSKKIQCLAPPLLLVEVGNGLRFSADNEENALFAFQKFVGLPLQYQEMTSAEYAHAISQAFRFGTTVYDASYHVLAQSRDATLLTCDQTFFKKVEHIGNITLLRHRG